MRGMSGTASCLASLRVSDLVFDERSSVVVDPSQEKLNLVCRRRIDLPANARRYSD